MGELDTIGALFTGEEGKAQVCLRRVVLEWLNNSTKPVTREALKEALETLGERRRAAELPEGLLFVGPRQICHTHSLIPSPPPPQLLLLAV